MTISTKTISSAFEINITDSTVYVGPGSTQVGNSIMFFSGGSISFSSMTNFDAANKYQYSALMLSNVNNWADLTAVVSPTSTSIAGLSFPIVNPDSAMSPVGLFMFKNTSIGIELLDFSRTV